MVNKIVWTLSLVCFSLSSLLSLVGIISVLEIYFHVSMTYAGLYAGIFTGTLGISSLIMPALFSRFEKKKLIITILIITIFCNVIEVFTHDYYIGLIFRMIPAFFYPIAVSSALTIVGKIRPNDTNKVVLGISAGSVLGLSITSYLGFTYGFQITMLWFVLINILAIISTVLFIPNFEGNKEPIMVQVSHAKSKLFAISMFYVFFMLVGISITYNYIPTYLNEVTRINGEMLFTILFLMGLTSMFGTGLCGYLLEKNPNLTSLFYAVFFSIIMVILGIFVKIPFIESIVILIFGIFDGFAYTISQYWITSSIPESPEFANGLFLLICNFCIFTGTMVGGFIIEDINIIHIFAGSAIMMILAIPFVLIRMKKYPKVY